MSRRVINNEESGASVRNKLNSNSAIGFRAPRTVLQDGKYNAFPGFAILADGTYLAAYRAGNRHAGAGEIGVIKLQMSTDQGETWSAPVTIQSDAAYDSRDATLALLSDGTVILSYFIYDGTSQTYIMACIRRSTNNGVSWGPQIGLPTYTAGTQTTGWVVELTNGDLLAPICGHDFGDISYRSGVVKSTDNGLTWEYLSTISTTRDRSETTLLLLPNSNIYALLRNEAESRFDYSVSSDSGTTWSAPSQAIANIEGRPSTLLLSNGDIVVAGRDIANYDPASTFVHLVSSDNGQTYNAVDQRSVHARHDGGRMMYSQMREIAPGIVGELYCEEPYGSAASSDVYFRHLVVGVDLPPYPAINADAIVSHGKIQTYSDIVTRGGVVRAAAATTARPSINIPEGVPPTSPVAGDVYASDAVLWMYDGAQNLPLSRGRVSEKTTYYRMTAQDVERTILINASTRQGWIIPANSAVPFPIGAKILGGSLGTGDVVITPDDGVTLLSIGGNLVSNGQYSRWEAHKIATDEWMISGDLTAGAPWTEPAGSHAFIAVSVDGSTNGITLSQDGADWEATTQAAKTWYDVTYDGTRFVAIGNNVAATSTDGITWTIRTIASGSWEGVAANSTTVVAVSDAGSAVISSDGGATWSAARSVGVSGLRGICWADTLELFVCVANTGSRRVATSPDGITWTLHDASDNGTLWKDICWSNSLGLLVAVGYGGTDNRIMTSTDGITWTTRDASDSAFYGVTWSPALSCFCAVAAGGAAKCKISSNGTTWVTQTVPNAYNDVTWSEILGLFVAVGNGASKAATSPDGITWTNRNIGNKYWWAVSCGY